MGDMLEGPAALRRRTRDFSALILAGKHGGHARGSLCGDERGTFRRSFLRGNVGDMLEGPSVKETERFELQMGMIHRISKNGHICPTSAQGSSAAMNAGLFGVNSCIGTLGGC
ncbi:hypothetical protein B0H16DRAFT_1464364 [Mycena metata]|uniref:Uncharacterized protein n=1 Tax=Mycena metata TaxID=1033252 RepID=A0AAD7IHA7_9AGAR|nr:hypothetical protein B0H16DRAFT_1464364 [Mycena metata]